MSLLSSTSSVVGAFTHLQTETLNGPRLLNFGGGADGDVLTFHPDENAWRPMPPHLAPNVYVDPVTTDATFFMTFVPALDDVVPLNTNAAITYNPATTVLTVPFVHGLSSQAVDSLNAMNVEVTNNTATNAPYYLTFVAGNTGNQAFQVDSVALQFNPALDTLTVPNLAGNASSATNVNVTNNTATNATFFPTFVAANAGNQAVQVNSANLTYNPNTNVLASALFSGSLINVVTINGAAYPPPLPSRVPTGNTLTVDAVYGDDGLAALNRYAVAFKTISAALLLAAAGQNVVVNAGTYEETLTIPDDVSLTGAGAQCVVIQKLDVMADTTLITVGTNCRLENFTANLSSAGNFNLTGISFPTGTSITTKMRNSIWTVTSTFVGAQSVIGVLSAGTSALGYTAVNAIQRSSINVVSSSNGISRGIYVSGTNRFSVRDMVVYARGTGTNIMGVETTGVNSYCEIKTSTIAGILSDISRTEPSSTILLGFTDLRFNHTNGHSFSVVTESSTTFFGVIGNLKNNHLYYLVPGGSTETTIDSLGAPFLIPTPQDMVLFSGTVNYTGAIAVGNFVTFRIYRSGVVPPVYTIQLTNGETIKTETTVSVDFNMNDTYYATLQTIGNPGNGTFTATLAFY